MDPSIPLERDAGPTYRLLLVEDNRNARLLLRRLLDQPGYELVETEAGRRALELVEGRGFDLVVLDLRLPDLDGLEVLRRLRRRFDPVDLPVIVLTASDESAVAVTALSSGANDFVTKPFEAPVLLARIRNQLTVKRSADGLRRLRDDLEAAVELRTEELRATNASLREGERRFRMISETSPIGIAVTSIGDGRFLFANPRMRDLVGAGPAALERCSATDICGDPGDRERLLADFSSHDGVENRELRIRRLDGHLRWALVSARRIDYEGEPAVLWAMHDITEAREARTRMFQTSKLSSLGEMAAGVARELSQPLQVIRFAAEIAADEMGREGRAAARQLQKIMSHVERANAIIDHMRLYGGRHADSPTRFPPREAILAAVGVMRRCVEDEGIELNLDLAADVPPVAGRRIEFDQVILHLLANARDALVARGAGAPGRIAIGLAANPIADEVVLTVRDNGGGIPEDMIERVFEPFFTTREDGRGTGLGLSVSHGIVADMGGRIDVANVDGGAEITVRLPAATSDAAAEPATDQPFLEPSPATSPS
jgi:PAS domain S-box-containing protein